MNIKIQCNYSRGYKNLPRIFEIGYDPNHKCLLLELKVETVAALFYILFLTFLNYSNFDTIETDTGKNKRKKRFAGKNTNLLKYPCTTPIHNALDYTLTSHLHPPRKKNLNKIQLIK